MILKIFALTLFVTCFALKSSSANQTNYPGRPVSILDFQTTKTKNDFVFNSQAFENILLHEDVINRKISVISIMGAFRKGKSFLLDYFLRYMYTNYKSVGSPSTPLRKGRYPEWIGGPDEPLKGFSWRSGSDRHTTGIVIWSDVFLYDAPNGDKIAIILMDTQGLFDRHSSPKDNSRIFSLSTLISSMQIFNLFGHIQEDHLQYLQFATEYARFATTNNDDQLAKPFQNLMFLIRDWNFPDDYEYGLNGGQQLLNKVLKIEEDQLPELKSLRQYIFASFSKISCFLMPHPGATVATKKKYDGRWSLIDKAFVDELKDLVSTLLAPENLSIKKINDQDLHVNEFYLYIRQYIQMFKSQDLPEPQSIYEATVTNHMQILVARSFTIYNEIIRTHYSNISELDQIELLQQTAFDKALEVYSKEKKMGTEEHDTAYKQDLTNKMQDAYKKWKPPAIEHIKKIQEIKRKIEEENRAKLAAQERAQQAKEKLDAANESLRASEAEVERVKHESFEIQVQAKLIQLEAQNIRNEAIRKEEEASRKAKEAKDREISYKAEMEAYRQEMKSQQESIQKQIELSQKSLENIRNQGNREQGGGDDVSKWVSLGVKALGTVAMLGVFFG